MKLDVLAFGAHPDDIELGCGGTLIKCVQQGYKVGMIDLTRGELGSRGTVDIRDAESLAAQKIIGAVVRENLNLRDGFFQNDEASQLKVLTAIRKYQPDVVFCNALFDRHPDHGRSAQLVEDASFLSGLTKIKTTENGEEQKAFRPRLVLHYIQAMTMKPDIVIDVTDVWDKKMQSILVHKSQFYDPNSTEPETYIASKEFIETVDDRAAEMGRSCGFRLAEGFVSKRILGVKGLFELV
ncbi:MAG: bacillithiol biosynthesis deacetylase BshB1 [Chitinophagales bacterium]